MKPRDLLVDRLREHVVPVLAPPGFNFAASGPRFSRRVGSVTQTISLSLSRWNAEDDATFWSMWSVTSSAFAKWHLAEWGERPANDALGGSADWNIPGWTRRPGDLFRLRNSAADAREMTVFVRGIEDAGLPFLDRISNWQGAAEQCWRTDGWYSRAADLFILAGQHDRAKAVLLEGIEAFATRRRDQSGEVPQLQARLQRYFPAAGRHGGVAVEEPSRDNSG